MTICTKNVFINKTRAFFYEREWTSSQLTWMCVRGTIWQEKKKECLLCLRPDLSVHYGCSGDAAGQWIYLKQAAHG